jgi:predicted DNA binding CopG/RHH family protein
MSQRTRYSDEPVEMEVVEDFLPPPEELAPRAEAEETVEVTIALSRSTVGFFKQHARRTGTSYQRMIRRVLDLYAAHYNS